MNNIRFLQMGLVTLVLLIGANGCKHEKGETVESSQPSRSISSNITDSTGKITVIDFYATWCGPCKMMTPVMEKMEEKYSNKIEFRKVDVDQNGELAQQYNIQSIPTLVILSPNNEVIDVVVGYHDANQMDEILGKL